MRLSTCILERRTFRTYTPEEVSERQLDLILRAAQWAPSPRNWQPWRFIVIRDEADKQALEAIARESKQISATWVPMFRPAGIRDYIQDMAHTPLAVAICADPDRRGQHVNDRYGHILGASMAIQNMKLMIHHLGLGAVLYTHWIEEKVKVYLGMPRLWTLVGLLCFGHPIPVMTKEREAALRRKPLRELGFAERYGRAHQWPAPAFTDAMEVDEAIFTRRSIRRFTADPISDAQLSQLLTAAQWAPSAGNHQPWRFVIIRDAGTRAALQRIAEEAHALSAHWDPEFRGGSAIGRPHDFTRTPVVIAVVADPARGGPHIHGETTHLVGAALAAQNMWLLAHALGLGATFITHVIEEKVKVLLGIPYDWDLAGLLALGYPDEVAASTRKPLEETVSYDRFGQVEVPRRRNARRAS